MADQTLTLTYSTTTGVVTQSGLTSSMPDVMRSILTQLGISFASGAQNGRLVDKQRFTSAPHRASIITRFNEIFDQDPNPYHATDNVTLTLTSA